MFVESCCCWCFHKTVLSTCQTIIVRLIAFNIWSGIKFQWIVFFFVSLPFINVSTAFAIYDTTKGLFFLSSISRKHNKVKKKIYNVNKLHHKLHQFNKFWWNPTGCSVEDKQIYVSFSSDFYFYWFLEQRSLKVE